MSLVSEDLDSKAEVYYDHEICEVKSRSLLRELGLPGGLLPLKDITECGFVEATGLVWIKQEREIHHYFDKVGRKVRYGREITAQVEKCRIKKLTGVKTKEMMVWISISEASASGDPPTGKITFKTPAGLVRAFPASAFEVEEQMPDR
ncbi:uncharacterized protein LOC121980075 [Zingiber officinale]|uniref:DUF538 domain-containing protein n=1 Tax=Zingiber officinale TaxID=94328 RepID=A0A8J5L7A5_ZINOF|nr:uncharacterized protein LOC121980075 [Zingiber officinale]KAG6508658.1 hypothetical protein ZIOFF_034038 [Zingiber officinale]